MSLCELRFFTTQSICSLNMYVEDRTSYNGPVQVAVKPNLTVAELKEHIQCEFEIPVGVQKWILGKSLADDDKTTLASHGITQSGQSIYLYLVAPKESPSNNKEKAEQSTKGSAEAVPLAKESNIEMAKKGRYWNYEEDRWSYCSSDDEGKEVKKPEQHKAADDEAKSEDDDYEWEYFYEDAEPKIEPKKEEARAEPVKNLPLAVAAAGKTQRVDPRDGWECPTCTLLNEPVRPGCEACTTERPKDYKIPPPGPLDTLPKGATAFVPEVPKVVTALENASKEKVFSIILLPSILVRFYIIFFRVTF